MKLPNCINLTIDLNPHKIVYQSVRQYIDHYDHFKESISKEDLEICMEKDEIWQLQWYPKTPISFYVVLSYSLERCLELAEEMNEKKEQVEFILNFLEYCYSSAECALYKEMFYGREVHIIYNFLKSVRRRNELDQS